MYCKFLSLPDERISNELSPLQTAQGCGYSGLEKKITKDETRYVGTTVLVKDQKFCCQEGQTIVMLK